MFSGIIEGLSKVISLEPSVLKIGAKDLSLEIKVGESISVNGVCLTVKKTNEDSFSFDLSKETLGKTNLNELKRGESVNLERALKAGERMGGHILNGHTDTTGRLERIEKRGDTKDFWISFPSEFRKYLVSKGSIGIEGVSLTVVEVIENEFSTTLIPFTLQRTNLGKKKEGDKLNLEFDILAKYLESIIKNWKKEKVDWQFLKETGY